MDIGCILIAFFFFWSSVYFGSLKFYIINLVWYACPPFPVSLQFLILSLIPVHKSHLEDFVKTQISTLPSSILPVNLGWSLRICISYQGGHLHASLYLVCLMMVDGQFLSSSRNPSPNIILVSAHSFRLPTPSGSLSPPPPSRTHPQTYRNRPLKKKKKS